MKPADLVFYDQVATGPVRFELSGNVALARSYLHAGRAQLGQMKAQTGVYDLQDDGGLVATGGTGFWNMSQTMPDGTVIQTMHNDGLEIVRISAPANPGPSPKKPKYAEQFIGKFLGACGGFGGTDDASPKAWVWKARVGFSYPDDLDGGAANGISWDADMACGTFVSDDDPFALNCNFVWTRTQGTDGTSQNIGLVQDYGFASCIGGDGELVGTSRGWYWSKQAGIAQVPLQELSMGPQESGTANIMCIGGDSTVMGGWIGVDNGFGGQFQRPCIWTFPAGGGVPAVTVLDDGDGTWQSTDVGLNLSATRTVIASGESETIEFFYTHYEGHTLVGSYQVSNTTGQQDLIGGYTYPLEPYEKVNFTHFGPDVEFGGVFTTEGITFDVLITHHMGGAVTGVRYDGSAACGYVAQQDIPDWQAAVWGSDLSLRIIGLPAGFRNAQATGISQSGDIVVSGYGQREDDGTFGWWTWSDADGFSIVSESPSMGMCITQDGTVSAGFIDGTRLGLISGQPSRHRQGGETTEFDVAAYGTCNGITQMTVMVDASGTTTFVPPMPGLKLHKEKIPLASLGEEQVFDQE